jgi:competence protein ComFB
MSFDNIHNYYETMVLTRLNEMVAADFIDPDPQFLEDVACVALNQLPARYIKHDIDMYYFMTIEEREKMEYDVHRAVTSATEYVMQNRNKRAKQA